MMDRYVDISRVPKKRLSNVEKQYIELSLVKLRIKRENASMILNKGSALYLFLTALGIAGVFMKMINIMLLGFFIVGGIVVLIISVLPIVVSNKKEEKELLDLIDSVIGKR